MSLNSFSVCGLLKNAHFSRYFQSKIEMVIIIKIIYLYDYYISGLTSLKIFSIDLYRHCITSKKKAPMIIVALNSYQTASRNLS